MRNRNEPAGAYTAAIYRDQDCPVQFVGGAEGLTKREAAAIAAMQGMLANHEASASIQEDAIEAGIHPADNMASIAVYAADALFDELEKDKDDDQE